MKSDWRKVCGSAGKTASFSLQAGFATKANERAKLERCGLLQHGFLRVTALMNTWWRWSGANLQVDSVPHLAVISTGVLQNRTSVLAEGDGAQKSGDLVEKLAIEVRF